MYRLLFGRAPTADELKAASAFLQAEALKQYDDRKAEAKTTAPAMTKPEAAPKQDAGHDRQPTNRRLPRMA